MKLNIGSKKKNNLHILSLFEEALSELLKDVSLERASEAGEHAAKAK